MIKQKKNAKIKKGKLVINIVLGILAVIWLFPVMYAVISSFKGRQEYNLGNFWDWPQGNHILENLQSLNSSISIASGMLNSILYAVLGALFAVAISVLAAYAIAHLKIRFRMFWFLFIYSGTIFPFQIYLIPIYRGYSTLGLYDTRVGMILFYTAICIPFSMFVLRNFFMGISKEICESAKVDGASDFMVLLKIFLPMAKAPLSIVFLSQFTWCWNDLMFGLTFTNSPEVRTAMSAVSLLGKANVPSLMLACILVSLPTILLFIFLQKNFEAGLVYQSK